jgi:hypothetical protein
MKLPLTCSVCGCKAHRVKAQHAHSSTQYAQRTTQADEQAAAPDVRTTQHTHTRTHAQHSTASHTQPTTPARARTRPTHLQLPALDEQTAAPDVRDRAALASERGRPLHHGHVVIHRHLRVRVCACVRVRVRVCVFTCVCVYPLYACKYVCVCVCVCVLGAGRKCTRGQVLAVSPRNRRVVTNRHL